MRRPSLELRAPWKHRWGVALAGHLERRQLALLPCASLLILRSPCLPPPSAGSYDDLVATPLARSRRSGGLIALNGSADALAAGLETPLSDLQPYMVTTAHADPTLAPMAEEPAAGAAAGGRPASVAGEPGSSLAAPFASRLRVASGSDSGSGAAGGGEGAVEAGEARTSPFNVPADAEMAEAAGVQQAALGQAGPEQVKQQEGQQRGGRQYWEEGDPSRALGMLEEELRDITGGLPNNAICFCAWVQVQPGPRGLPALRR